MPKSIGQAEEQKLRLGRFPFQILAQEDTLKSLEQKDFASQATLAAILVQLNITLSAFRDALKGAANKDFSTLETDAENVYTKLNAQLNITLSALRDAICDATTPKDLKDLWDKIESLKGTPAKTLQLIWDKLDYIYAFGLKWSHSTNIRNVTMTLADTEYFINLDYDAHFITAHTRDGTEWRYAKTTGKVAAPTEPYWTVKADTELKLQFIMMSGYKLYCACSQPGKVVELIEACT